MDVFTPWFESAVVGVVALLGFGLGRWFSRRPGRSWLVGYLIPLGLILLYCLAMFEPAVALTPPISWMMIGRSRFAAFNFIAVMLLTVPLSRLPEKRTRVVICGLLVVLTSMAILPFLAPAFNRSYLAGLQTRIDPKGVCRQSNDYTCGPAAAVTALRRLGLPAEEGEIAILSHTSLIAGTEPDVLASVLRKRYARDGLSAEYRSFRDLAALQEAGLTVAVLKFNSLQDHCVTILGVETNRVVIGDPLSGLESIPTEEFLNKWQFVGVVLKRSVKPPATRQGPGAKPTE